MSTVPSGIEGGAYAELAVADVNHDGFEDILTDDEVVLGSSAGTPTILPLDGELVSNALVDLNGDGQLDVVGTRPNWSGGSDTLAMMLGDGGRSFRTVADLCFDYTPFVATADFNRDGYADLAVSLNPERRAITLLYGTDASVRD